MAIVFAAFLPQLRVIQNSWDTKIGASETLQNGRVLIDHIHNNLSKAARITAVSGSSDTNGYIEFLDNDANNVRYDIGANNYVEFGPIGNLSDLAGPVSKLQFTCYSAVDLSTPITDVNAIRCVKVETTLTNPAKLDQDMNFSTKAYIRTNAIPANFVGISKMSEPWLEFDTQKGMEPALAQIDSTHYLCAYRGDGDDGWAVVLTVDTGTWNVSKELAYEYDVQKGIAPVLAQIDQTHYLCAYQGDGDDGWARILNVNTSNWEITEDDNFEFDQIKGISPALVQIDQTHYLCAYQGDGDDGWAVVLSIAAPLFDAISMGTPFEFDTKKCITPALSKVDDTHYLCAYHGDHDDGWAIVLTIDTGSWTISGEQPYEYEISKGKEPALAKIYDGHYLCTYLTDGDVGLATVLMVDTETWTITNQTPFEYDTVGMTPALSNIYNTHCLCAYMGPYSDGWSVVLTTDSSNWTVTKETPFEFDVEDGASPALAKIDDYHYLCAYAGPGDDGYAGVLELNEEILP
jgi:hypothetical protein